MKDEKELNYDPDRFREGIELPYRFEKGYMNPAYKETENLQEVMLEGTQVLDILSPEMQDVVTGCSHIAQVYSAVTGEWRCRDCGKLIEQY